MANETWQCPYCQHRAVLSSSICNDTMHGIHNEGKNALRVGRIWQVVCPNPECGKVELAFHYLQKKETNIKGQYEYPILQTWRLLPASDARPFPSYIPVPIRADYEEACAIKTLSPKASATLSRRCLQGMIRDFHGISMSRLVDEIAAIEKKVPPAIWASIDAVRSVGNIGAHMERDINVIVDVDPDEAQLLIELLEQLMEDWYIQRHEQNERTAKITAMAQEKKKQKKQKKS